MSEIETVTIARPEHPDGFVVINKEDLKDDDVIFGEAVKEPTQKGQSRKVQVR